MEQLLFPFDIKKASEIAENNFPAANATEANYVTTGDQFDLCEEIYAMACQHKNNQMQEFDKWKEENGWKYSKQSNKYWRFKNILVSFEIEIKSFSELFEIFIKETQKQ